MGAERENIGRMGTSPNGNVTIENMLACMPIISILLRGPNCALKVNDHGYRDNFEIALHFCDFKHANEGKLLHLVDAPDRWNWLQVHVRTPSKPGVIHSTSCERRGTETGSRLSCFLTSLSSWD